MIEKKPTKNSNLGGLVAIFLSIILFLLPVVSLPPNNKQLFAVLYPTLWIYTFLLWLRVQRTGPPSWAGVASVGVIIFAVGSVFVVISSAIEILHAIS